MHEFTQARLVDTLVHQLQSHFPGVSFTRRGAGEYDVQGRPVRFEVSRNYTGRLEVLVVDGPLRQPLADYVAGKARNEAWSQVPAVQSALHALPERRRVSFEEVFPSNRAEAMEVAVMEAVAREQHAQEELSKQRKASSVSPKQGHRQAAPANLTFGSLTVPLAKPRVPPPHDVAPAHARTASPRTPIRSDVRVASQTSSPRPGLITGHSSPRQPRPCYQPPTLLSPSTSNRGAAVPAWHILSLPTQRSHDAPSLSPPATSRSAKQSGTTPGAAVRQQLASPGRSFRETLPVSPLLSHRATLDGVAARPGTPDPRKSYRFASACSGRHTLGGGSVDTAAFAPRRRAQKLRLPQSLQQPQPQPQQSQQAGQPPQPQQLQRHQSQQRLGAWASAASLGPPDMEKLHADVKASVTRLEKLQSHLRGADDPRPTPAPRPPSLSPGRAVPRVDGDATTGSACTSPQQQDRTPARLRQPRRSISAPTQYAQPSDAIASPAAPPLSPVHTSRPAGSLTSWGGVRHNLAYDGSTGARGNVNLRATLGTASPSPSLGHRSCRRIKQRGGGLRGAGGIQKEGCAETASVASTSATSTPTDSLSDPRAADEEDNGGATNAAGSSPPSRMGTISPGPIWSNRPPDKVPPVGLSEPSRHYTEGCPIASLALASAPTGDTSLFAPPARFGQRSAEAGAGTMATSLSAAEREVKELHTQLLSCRLGALADDEVTINAARVSLLARTTMVRHLLENAQLEAERQAALLSDMKASLGLCERGQ